LKRCGNTLHAHACAAQGVGGEKTKHGGVLGGGL
jgi:hypothetical protein